MHRVDVSGPLANQVVFGALNVVVVIPALVALIAIAVGFKSR